MTETLIILILLFNGELLKEKVELPFAMEIHECLMFADSHREAIATYKEYGLEGQAMDQGWYLNDGRGTVQGFLC